METKAEQFYPTYKLKKRDVVLIEFEEAQKIANSQNKVYGQVSNILLAASTFAITFYLDSAPEKIQKVVTFISVESIAFCIVLFFVGWIILRYFVDLQKQITINARKVVTLRTLLGLDYGTIHLTLPNWRVEGATNPFAIKYFNGWLKFKTSPFWVVTLTVNVIWFLSTKNHLPIEINCYLFIVKIKLWYINVSITIFYLSIFRFNLNDRHETVFLIISKLIISFIRVKLLVNFEYILYRSKLAYLELDRLKVDYEIMLKVLVQIEDQTFYGNKGYSFKAVIRGFLSRFKRGRKRFGITPHGGSTLTMQLVRSLFIPSNQNKYRRKIAEILLAVWLNKEFPKKEILKLYISSVRYERGVIGLANAIKHFFRNLKGRQLTVEESFFLVERLSIISSTANWERIKILSKRVIPEVDEQVLISLYVAQFNARRIIKLYNFPIS